jgi:hypothetical protein
MSMKRAGLPASVHFTFLPIIQKRLLRPQVDQVCTHLHVHGRDLSLSHTHILTLSHKMELQKSKGSTLSPERMDGHPSLGHLFAFLRNLKIFSMQTTPFPPNPAV